MIDEKDIMQDPHEKLRRLQDMDQRIKNGEALTKKLSDASPVTGESGLLSMMTMGATAPDRWLPFRKANAATVKKGKKQVNRARNKAAAANRRKNRR